MRKPEDGPDARLDGRAVREVSHVWDVWGIWIEGVGHIACGELFEGTCFYL